MNDDLSIYYADQDTNDTFEIYGALNDVGTPIKINRPLLESEDILRYVASSNNEFVIYEVRDDIQNTDKLLLSEFPELSSESIEEFCMPVITKSENIAVVCI